MENGENAGPAEDESTILTEGRSRPFCVVCQVEIVDSLKAIKQHLKSKPHKAALIEGGGCGGACACRLGVGGCLAEGAACSRDTSRT